MLNSASLDTPSRADPAYQVQPEPGSWCCFLLHVAWHDAIHGRTRAPHRIDALPTD